MSQASDAQSSAGGPEIVEFGPYRAIGVRIITKGGPECGAVWGAAHAWLAAHPEWEGFCGPQGCDCAEHPAFELYPPRFPADERLFLYLPVRRRV